MGDSVYRDTLSHNLTYIPTKYSVITYKLKISSSQWDKHSMRNMKTEHHPVCASHRNVKAVVLVTEQGPTDVASAPSEHSQSNDAPLHLQRNDWVIMTTLASLPHPHPLPPPPTLPPIFFLAYVWDGLFTNSFYPSCFSLCLSFASRSRAPIFLFMV